MIQLVCTSKLTDQQPSLTSTWDYYHKHVRQWYPKKYVFFVGFSLVVSTMLFLALCVGTLCLMQIQLLLQCMNFQWSQSKMLRSGVYRINKFLTQKYHVKNGPPSRIKFKASDFPMFSDVFLKFCYPSSHIVTSYRLAARIKRYHWLVLPQVDRNTSFLVEWNKINK